MKDIIGKKYFKLTVLEKVPSYRGKFNWKCKCDCGNITIELAWKLENGYRKSCGCWYKPRLKKLSDEERFWSFVEKTHYCWIWNGCKTQGYGEISINGMPKRCNRYSWNLHFGKIPRGLLVCHSCDNPACVRPDHLFLGSQKDNMQDCLKKGRCKNHLSR